MRFRNLEKKNRKRKKKKKSNLLRIILIILFYIAWMGGVSIVTFFYYSNSATLIKLENYKGNNIKDVIKVLKAKKIKYKIEYEYSDAFEKDIVLKQYPASGHEIKSNRIIKLTVSKGENLIQMPDFRGLGIIEVNNYISQKKKNDINYNLKIGSICSIYDNNIKKGKIIDQEINPGELVKKNTIFSVLISLGIFPEYVEVPSVIGKPISEAKQILKQAHLNLVDNYRYAVVTDLEENTVIEQSIAANSYAKINERIYLTLSTKLPESEKEVKKTSILRIVAPADFEPKLLSIKSIYKNKKKTLYNKYTNPTEIIYLPVSDLYEKTRIIIYWDNKLYKEFRIKY